MSPKKIVSLIFLFCVMAQSLFINALQPKLPHCNERNRCHKPLSVHFTYCTPKDFKRGETLFIYFFIVDLLKGVDVKMVVKEITKPNQKIRTSVCLKPRELVFAFLYSKTHPFSSFNQKELGLLKAKIGCHSPCLLEFVKYDASTGVTLFDPFNLER